MARCGGCGRAMFFAVTRNEKLIPVDVETSLDGNVEVTPTPGDGPPFATVHAQPPAFAEGTLHHTHFETCPKAADHRQPRAARR